MVMVGRWMDRWVAMARLLSHSFEAQLGAVVGLLAAGGFTVFKSAEGGRSILWDLSVTSQPAPQEGCQV